MTNHPNILICPLDWGLGHAVRCVPIIRELIKQGAIPIIAAANGPLELLGQEFPDVKHIHFPGVHITYPSNGKNMAWSMLKQSPSLFYGIKKETGFIKKIVQELDIDGIISDNRFGAFSKTVPSVYITHQINIQTGNKITDALAYRQHKQYMNKFMRVWIPDYADDNSISGKLSHGNKLPEHAEFIGPLSRFTSFGNYKKEYDVSFILSGPEPQRSILQDELIKQAKEFPDKKFLLVCGKNWPSIELPENMDRIPMADAKAIEKIYATSENIVCRSGYTGIMEMASSGRSAWLIPTPGQTEQEYLAQHLNGLHGFLAINQHDFQLADVLNNKIPQPLPHHTDNHLLENSVKEFLGLTETKKVHS